MPIENNLVGFDVLDQKEERLGLKCPSLLEVQIAKPVQMALAKGLRMANSASDYTIVRFSSCTLAEEGREQALEELHERGLLPTRFMRYSNAASRVDLVNRTMPGLRILTASYMSVLREGVRQDGDLLYLCMTLSGTTLGRRRGHEMVLSAGDAVLMTNEEATWTMTSPLSSKIAGIRVPRSAIAPLVPKLGNVTMRRITEDKSGLRLLRKYLNVVADDEALAAPGSQRVIVSHFYDLVALVLGASSDAKALAADRTVGAVRLAEIKADIVANLHDGTLNAAMVATRHRVSVRYLHKLFENEGITYSEFVLGQRLARAYSFLRNPLQSHCAIGTLAFELGFNDLSYFNRAFRRRYNATPSDIRNGAGMMLHSAPQKSHRNSANKRARTRGRQHETD